MHIRIAVRSHRFNLDDLALQDLPAFVDYVLGASGAQSVATVTWSAVRPRKGAGGTTRGPGCDTSVVAAHVAPRCTLWLPQLSADGPAACDQLQCGMGPTSAESCRTNPSC